MTRSSVRRVRTVAAAVLVTLMVVACGGAASPILAPVGQDAGARGERTGGNPAPAPVSGDTGGTATAVKDDARIVRTGSLQLQVDELGPALQRAREEIRDLGGYISASEQTNDGERSIATVTYRIPSDRWEEGLEALRAVGRKVLDERTEAVEVTGQLVDLGARIENLRASERALQGIAAQATKIADVLEVQGRLTQVRGEIEQLAAQQAQLEDRAGYGTLSVTFGIQVVAVTEAAKKWDPGTELDRATASLVDILQVLATAGIWFAIVWLPILIVLLLIVLAVVFVLRRAGVLQRRQPAVSAAPAPPAGG